MNKLNYTNEDLDILTKTIYAEARGEFYHPKGGIKSLQAIALVVKNRLEQKKFGNTIKEVCLKKWQFSCWNENDINFLKITNLKQTDDMYQICLKAAREVIDNKIQDFTIGANHYHSSLMLNMPYWAVNKKPTIIIARHVFYKI